MTFAIENSKGIWRPNTNYKHAEKKKIIVTNPVLLKVIQKILFVINRIFLVVNIQLLSSFFKKNLIAVTTLCILYHPLLSNYHF
jgi:hypothetical protein